jgi:hypothetical protein
MRTLPLVTAVVVAAGLATSGCGGDDQPEGGAAPDRAVCGVAGRVLGIYTAVVDRGDGSAARMASTWNDGRDEVAALVPDIEEDEVRRAAQAVADTPDAVNGIGATMPTGPWTALGAECSVARIDMRDRQAG